MPAASGTPSPGPASSQLPVSADIGSAPPILDAFGNPLELPGHIAPHQVFELLDQALPFEVCLYHRVLPLSIHQNQLHLGMVDPHDEQALDYIGRIAAYSDRTLAPIPLAGHLHQVLLSAYLHHRSQPAVPETKADVAAKSNDNPANRHIVEVLQDETMPEAGPETVSHLSAHGSEPVHQSLEEWELETLFPSSTATSSTRAQDGQASHQDLGITTGQAVSASTLNIEQPSHLETLLTTEVKAKAITKRRQEPSPVINQRMTLILDETEIMAELAQATQASNVSNRLDFPTLVDEVVKEQSTPGKEPVSSVWSRDLVEDSPRLNDDSCLPKHLERLVGGELSQRDWPGIAHLPPNLILQAMLGRMLQGNITRLRMERYRRPQTDGELAQLLWNPAGVLQPVWSGFSLGSFAALAKALRELAQIPLGPIQQPIQRGTMRHYQGQPLLLLMQFLPGAKVAVIELRLLQDEALREFQQQQGAGLGREALLTAQILQHQVQQLFDHNQRYPESSPVPEQLMTVIGYLEKMIAGQTTTDSSV